MPPLRLSDRLESIKGVRLAGSPHACDVNVHYSSDTCHGTIASITPHDFPPNSEPSQPPLLLPALTHPHIHLDKAFVHSASEYVHLLPSTGTFQEALSFTTEAKASFTRSDLLTRGEWLLAESVSSGVTAIRAFVEIDHTVQLKCLDAGVTLKDQWSNACEIQIVCFAQDPIFSSDFGEENMVLIEKALARYPQIDVIGTTPYVESSIEAAKKNIDWAVDQALQLEKHLDFHLDYHLDPNKEALVWYLLETLKQRGWTTTSITKRVMLGHCTRLSLFSEREWAQISRIIHENDLPVSFVGLPTSDLYMAAPQQENQGKPRGTLEVPEIIRKYELDVVMGVNNVGNAFTPWGSADPLFLACLGVGLYQAGSQTDAGLLYECVSTRARASIGLSSPKKSLAINEGDCADFIVFRDRDDTGCGISRPRKSVAEIVWDPPGRINRDLVVNGRLNVSRGTNYDAEPLYQYL
ncbi:uncharacterized protein N7443_000997 [Penicillium atrosanguineum]|uniref:uncharacterized protein n=1 Tax=Penicillium atrosanguineum TaxID=1132637 RepID=UPI002388F431|nr:uncharacterized protein N7443_000997 [Penicillium atrosanguineum]KAJ5314113.1 hypothetical protein N7443_000997 [Penicillium atrosanguineum]